MLYLRATRTPGVLSSQAEYGTRILPALADQLATETTACRHQRPRPARAAGRVRCDPGRGREEAAHRFADAGWHVFPAEPGGKRPATEHGYLDATTSHKAIQQWWRAEPRSNLAVATGAPGPDVLDVDKHKDGNGFAAFNKLKQAGLVRDPMAIVRTPSGGFHAYYKGTEHQRNGHIPRRLRGLPEPGRLRGRAAVHDRRPDVRGGAEAGQRRHVRLGRRETGA